MVELKQFDRPESIMEYGKMVQGFNEAMKTLPEALKHFKDDPAYLESFVGEGPYNALDVQGYVRYGQEQHAEGRHKESGLFGAFGIIHLPEIKLSSRAPKILGEDFGCKFTAYKDGKKYVIPLQNVRFGYLQRGGQVTISARSRKGQPTTITVDQPGRITLAADTVLYNAEHPDDTIMLSQGTVVTGIGNYGYSRADVWAKDEHGNSSFAIIDKQGKALDEANSVMMLWCHLMTIHGLKRHGYPSDAFTTFQLDGPDDDFNAERKVVAWIKSFKKNHDIDLVPYFNEYVQSTHDALMGKPALLYAIAKSLKIAQVAEPLQHYGNSGNLPYNEAANAVRTLTVTRGGLRGAIDMLQLTLPEVTLSAADEALIESAKNLVLIQHAIEYAKSHVFHSDPLDPTWVEGTGNQFSRNDRETLATMVTRNEDIASVEERVQRHLKSIAHSRLNSLHKQLQGVLGSAVGAVRNSNVLSGTARKQMLHRLDHCRGALDVMQQHLLWPDLHGADFSSQLSVMHEMYDALEDLYKDSKDLKRKNTHHWHDKGAPKFEKFFKIFDTVGGDANRLMDMYTDVSCLGLRGHAGPPPADSHVARIAGAQGWRVAL